VNCVTETQLGAPESEKTSTGLEQNTAALLSYLFTWVTGLIFYLLEKDNKYVRFHAMQSIFFGIAMVVAGVVLVILTTVLRYVPFIGGMTSMLDRKSTRLNSSHIR
jgi:uncharacterized membrane protein